MLDCANHQLDVFLINVSKCSTSSGVPLEVRDGEVIMMRFNPYKKPTHLYLKYTYVCLSAGLMILYGVIYRRVLLFMGGMAPS